VYAYVYLRLDLLHQKDYAIRCLCDDKFNATLELLELFAKDELFGGVSFMPISSLFFFTGITVRVVLEYLLFTITSCWYYPSLVSCVISSVVFYGFS